MTRKCTFVLKKLVCLALCIKSLFMLGNFVLSSIDHGDDNITRMVNELLDDLDRRGLFTRRELAEIVKQRRNFEYRLKRPSPLKQDFLAYVEYETRLDSLQRLRKKSVARELSRSRASRPRRRARRSPSRTSPASPESSRFTG